ncbi:unnamed protein product [Cyclocybe aegerita]|uniref:Tetraspanin n=1 Tax=Cyclocybe aegerita TaxID=1973307 RepID=A0A8S0W8S2_CYCAE|nr:unnamed protein product [Cyclocybe aegerita]
MAAKFLCCLPLRLGVVVISFLQFLFSGAAAGLLWWALWYNHENDLAAITQSMKTTVIIVAVIYTVAALVGLLGFLGALLRKNAFVKTFYVLLCAVFGFQIGSSIWYLVTFYRNRGQSLEDCLNGTTDANLIAYCQSMDAYKRVPQGVLIASAIVPILIQGYACYVVHQYSNRLTQQRAEQARAAQVFVPPSGPAYQPVMRNEETYPLTNQITYPYADNTHSFGHQAQKSVDAGQKV